MRFSILATHYDQTVSDDTLQRFLTSLKCQIFKDFEVIVLHDGPMKKMPRIDSNGLNLRFIESNDRANKWGHNMRSTGIEESTGDYILHTNTDNEYMPEALYNLDKSIEPNIHLYVMPIIMMGLNYNNHVIWYDTPRDYNVYHILQGVPIRRGNIDMMQLIASREAWNSIGGWYEHSEQSDGYLYEQLNSLYEHKYVSCIIGKHY